MNQNLCEAFDLAGQIEAILYAIDETFLEDADSRLQSLHVTMGRVLSDLVDALDRLAADQTVVDAIYAVNDVQRRK